MMKSILLSGSFLYLKICNLAVKGKDNVGILKIFLEIFYAEIC